MGPVGWTRAPDRTRHRSRACSHDAGPTSTHAPVITAATAANQNRAAHIPPGTPVSRASASASDSPPSAHPAPSAALQLAHRSQRAEQQEPRQGRRERALQHGVTPPGHGPDGRAGGEHREHAVRVAHLHEGGDQQHDDQPQRRRRPVGRDEQRHRPGPGRRAPGSRRGRSAPARGRRRGRSRSSPRTCRRAAGCPIRPRPASTATQRVPALVHDRHHAARHPPRRRPPHHGQGEHRGHEHLGAVAAGGEHGVQHVVDPSGHGSSLPSAWLPSCRDPRARRRHRPAPGPPARRRRPGDARDARGARRGCRCRRCRRGCGGWSRGA